MRGLGWRRHARQTGPVDMNEAELEVLRALDEAVSSARERLDEIAERVEADLEQRPDAVMSWEPVPLSTYPCDLPGDVRSSWVFVLRSGAVTGAERHPNSCQRMVSYRGSGDFQTRPGKEWRSHLLVSDLDAPLLRRWISIPVNVWHQAVEPEGNWVVVSFQTAAVAELIEERPDPKGDGTRRRTYVEPP